MKNILLLFSLILIGYSPVAAQMIHSPAATIAPTEMLRNRTIVHQHNPTPFLTQDVPIPYSYYDNSLPTVNWIVGGYYPPLVMEILAERISLQTDGGFVDSLRVSFGAVSPDSFFVALIEDTFIRVSDGRSFHLINVFNPNAKVYDYVRIAKQDIVSGSPTTIRFNHSQVPKDFAVAFYAEIDTAQHIFSPYEVLGDRESMRTLAMDNTHSNLVASSTQTGQRSAYVLDSLFVANGEPQPIYSNLLVTAYVTSASSEVQTYGYQSQELLKVFPNPASANVTLITENGITAGHLDLIDVSGHTCWSGSIDGVRQLDVSNLPSGVYRAVYHSGLTSITKTISIAH